MCETGDDDGVGVAICLRDRVVVTLVFNDEPGVVVGDDASASFTGEALGDFPGGDARMLYRSIQRLFSLPDDTVVLPGHDYHGRRDSLIGVERRENPRFAGHTLDSFVAQMQALQLPPPRMIEAAVPANKLAGAGVRIDRLVHGV